MDLFTHEHIRCLFEAKKKEKKKKKDRKKGRFAERRVKRTDMLDLYCIFCERNLDTDGKRR